MNVPLYILFFCSGISGLIYQVVWIREFGNVFGNTVYSAALVIAVFMLGLGVGSYLIGAWADRRYADRPDSLLKAYGGVKRRGIATRRDERSASCARRPLYFARSRQ